MFNLLGIAVIGSALQRRLGRAGWSLIYLAGGPGTIALYIAWHPGDTGGGSSAGEEPLPDPMGVDPGQARHPAGQPGWVG